MSHVPKSPCVGHRLYAGFREGHSFEVIANAVKTNGLQIKSRRRIVDGMAGVTEGSLTRMRDFAEVSYRGGIIQVLLKVFLCCFHYLLAPHQRGSRATVIAGPIEDCGQERAYNAGGGNMNAGQQTYGLLCQAGLENVQIRVAVVALPPAHPFLRLAIQFATSLRQRIVEGGFLTEQELDDAIKACEVSAQDPGTFGISFLVTQVWGRKPQA